MAAIEITQFSRRLRGIDAIRRGVLQTARPRDPAVIWLTPLPPTEQRSP